MPRPHRISRGLIGMLAVVIVLGLGFYLNNVRKSSASEQQPPRAGTTNSAPAVLPGSDPRPPTPKSTEPPKVIVNQTPANPATRPARPQTAGLPASAGSSSTGGGSADSYLTTLNEA